LYFNLYVSDRRLGEREEGCACPAGRGLEPHGNKLMMSSVYIVHTCTRAHGTISIFKFQIEDGKREDSVKKKGKLSRYTPWRHMGGKEIQLPLILNLGTRWG
jgi:hypothetical protein